MAAPCVIKRSDGRYLKKPRTPHSRVSWVSKLQEARVFSTRALASGMVNYESLPHRRPDFVKEDLTIVGVMLVEAQPA